jgi:ethanolamine utilization protein EutP (predicted NTPase)
MAFVLKQSATYKWPVTILLPVDGGKKEKHTFDAEFRRLPQSRTEELVTQLKMQERADIDPDQILLMKDAAKEILVGWSGVQDDSGEEIPFSEAALEQVLEIQMVAAQIILGWFNSLEVAKRKN